MCTSAKLNLFFGVRNLSEEFLPAHLTCMGRYFRRRNLNFFLPISIALSTLVLVFMTQCAVIIETTTAEAAGLILVGSMLVIAILEHFLLVLPLPPKAL